MINKEKNFVSLVVYVHNQQDKIEKFLLEVSGIIEKNFEKYEIICVNDCSCDDSVVLINKCAEKLKGSLSVINMSFYQGVELSVDAGVDLAIGDFVYEFDSMYIDYDLENIMKVYNRSLEGYDIVSASPKTIYRKSSKLFYYMYNRNSNSENKLTTECFRILSRRAINRVHSMSKTIPYRKAIYSNCGLKIDTIQYENSKDKREINFKGSNEYRKDKAIDTMMLFTDIAYKMAIVLAGLMMLITIGTSIYTLIVFLGDIKPVAGWTSIMLFLSISFFFIFAIFAVIIKYLTIIVDLIFKKQKYTIESINKISK